MASAVEPPPAHPPQLTNLAPATWHRVHAFDAATGRFGPAQFNDSGRGNARFSPLFDPATNAVIPTLYAADSEAGAIMEIVLHDVPLPSAGYIHDLQRDLGSRLHMSRVAMRKLHLVNLTSMGLQAMGLQPSELFESNKDDYPRTRRWALWIWQHVPGAQGLLWMSRRDNRRRAIMVFGDRLAGGDLRPLSEPRHISVYEDLIVELLAELGAGVAPNI